MQKTRIEWVRNPDGSQGFSWNPIKGLCPVGCWYCYARRMYQRFKWNREIRIDADELYVLGKTKYANKKLRIFTCSTIDLFHPDISEQFRNNIFFVIEACPEHTFIILTKCPENIDRPMPNNVWLGVSLTGQQDWYGRVAEFGIKRQRITDNFRNDIKLFISIEPLLSRIKYFPSIDYFSWIIIGRLTGFGHKYDPNRQWIEEIVNQAKKYEIPVFLKDNLKGIWPRELIQEFPRVK